MAGEEYKVQIKVNVGGAPEKKLSLAQKAASRLGNEIWKVVTRAGSMAAAFVAAQLSLNVLAQGMRAFVGFMRNGVQYSSQIEGMQIGLASMLSSVQGISFGKATQEADALYQRIVRISAESPLGPKEMFEIFGGLNASMMQAGKSTEEILQTMKDAGAAARAMNVDISQATRDIGLMTAGRAGADVKTFVELNRRLAFGGKRLSTKEFNKMDAEKRVEVLQKAFKRVGGEAAKAFANSFIGLTSTFQGLFNEFRRAFISPALDAFKQSLGGLNQFLIQNTEPIKQAMMAAGQLFATVVKPVMAYGVIFAKWLLKGAEGLAESLDTAFRLFTFRMDELFSSEIGMGAGVNIGDWDVFVQAGQLLSETADAFDFLLGYAEPASQALYEIGQLMALSTWGAFQEAWRRILEVIRPLAFEVLADLISQFVGLGVAFSAFMVIIEDLASTLNWFSGATSDTKKSFDDLYEAAKKSTIGMVWLANGMLKIYAYGKEFAAFMMRMSTADYIGAIRQIKRVLTQGVVAPQLKRPDFPGFEPALMQDDSIGRRSGRGRRKTPAAPKVEVKKMEVKIQQDFRNQTNPDRIVRLMYNDLTSQAERNISSPFLSALTR